MVPPRTLAILVSLGAFALAGCGSPRSSEPAGRPSPPDPVKVLPGTPAVSQGHPAEVDPILLQTLAILATGHRPAPAAVAETQHAIAAGTLTVPRYIDSLVATDAFAERVAPLVVLREYLSLPASAAPSGYVLQQTEGADAIYYLDKSCTAKQAVHVHPWWDMTSEVAVCPDAYLPSMWVGKPFAKDHTPMACLSQGAPVLESDHLGVRCGCGPNLMRCFKSGAQRNETLDSLRGELRATVSELVRKDRPAQEIFTSNNTWRDRAAEFVRIEQDLESSQAKDPSAQLEKLATWPAGGAWAPRTEAAPGSHAGILTSPLIVYGMSDLRQRMTIIYDVLWCTQADSAGATPDQAIMIRGGDLQLHSAGWKDLASKPVCTNCHARLDYGLQFFTGWPNAYRKSYFDPAEQQKGSGPLYGDNIDDPRGDAPLSPKGFAELAVAQPEFRRCMARDVGAFVFGEKLSASHLDLLEKVAEGPNGTSLRALMRASLEMLATQWKAPRPAMTPSTSVASNEPTITISKTQHEQLDKFCFACHEAEPLVVDLSTPTMSRRGVVEILNNVAYGRMPKGGPLDAGDRRAFLDLFISALWSGKDAADARAYFIERHGASPAFRPEVMLDLVEARVGKRGGPWRMLEQGGRPEHQQVTPGLVTTFGIASVEACRLAFTSRAEIDQCIERTVDPLELSIAPR